ncbi:hypothetical protein Tco_1070774 [Tanacetum coccineum]|uniref:Uncharacterized protein n=1 Tax=Tanacetum coccineum TaxID=301880 RepID=A0ABQ5HME6_9ASTR
MSNTNTNFPTQTSSVLYNETVSSCSTSKVQEKTQLLRSRCMNSLREVKSQFKFLSETLQDFGTMPIFKRTFSQDLDLLEQHLTKDILSQTDCNTTLTKLRTMFENAFNSEFKERMQRYTRFNAQSFQDAMICNMDSIRKLMCRCEGRLRCKGVTKQTIGVIPKGLALQNNDSEASRLQYFTSLLVLELLRTLIEQRIAAMMGYRGGSGG